MLKLVKITEVKSEKERKDGKVSRKYYTATFADTQNPFLSEINRNFFQSHNVDKTEATWRGADPAQVKAFIGKAIPGSIVSEKVQEYEIGENKANSYKTVVLVGEDKTSVFRQLGHPLLTDEAAQAPVAFAVEAAPEVAGM